MRVDPAARPVALHHACLLFVAARHCRNALLPIDDELAVLAREQARAGRDLVSRVLPLAAVERLSDAGRSE